MFGFNRRRTGPAHLTIPTLRLERSPACAAVDKGVSGKAIVLIIKVLYPHSLENVVQNRVLTINLFWKHNPVFVDLSWRRDKHRRPPAPAFFQKVALINRGKRQSQR